jgi:S-adenosylmethionine decarboxylase
MQQQGTASGKHLLMDLYGASGLTDGDFIEKTLRAAAKVCGATVLNAQLHHFGENLGVTGVVLLAESHISIHTWPENDFAAIDLFMCGNCDPEKAIEPLKAAFAPEKVNLSCHNRGMANLPHTIARHSALENVSTPIIGRSEQLTY